MNSTIKIRWILAHVPYDLFLRSANAFAKKVNELTSGEIEVEVLGKPEWEQKYNHGKFINNFELVKRMEDGEIEMTQLYSTTLGSFNKDYWALDLPYLFKDHDHASRVFDGPVGEGILGGLAETSGVRGLAFTYSGGYKMMASNKKLTNILDLKGMVMRCGKSPVCYETFKAAGMIPVPKGVDFFAESVASNEVEGGEQTFPRYFRSKVNTVTDNVTTTDHALFLTSIIVSSKFWDTLSFEHQTIIKECVKFAAISEREESLIDGEQAKQRCHQEGITVNEWSADLKNEFREITAPVYTKFENFFIDKEIINKIINS
jgi:TRAP-type C4-dicarboxylate transport system substrate-binding protein